MPQPEGVALPRTDTVREPEGHPEPLGDPLTEGEGESLSLALPLRDTVSEPLGDSLADEEGETLPDELPLTDPVSEPEGHPETLGGPLSHEEGEPLPEMVLLGQPDEDTDALPLGEADDDTDTEPLSICDTEAESEAEADAEGDPDGEKAHVTPPSAMECVCRPSLGLQLLLEAAAQEAAGVPAQLAPENKDREKLLVSKAKNARRESPEGSGAQSPGGDARTLRLNALKGPEVRGGAYRGDGKFAEAEAAKEGETFSELVTEGDPIAVTVADAQPLAVKRPLAVTLADPLSMLLALKVSIGV